jgi:hypothetical protein
MNERLQHLAREAGHFEFNKWGYFDINKFAELIVQRTLAIVEAHTEIFQSDEARVMVEHIKRSVKTDFGVEQ